MKCLCIYNPKSGKGKAEKQLDYIKEYLTKQEAFFDIYKISSITDLNDFIFSYAKDYDLIITMGGDGTIHTVFNALMLIERKDRPKVLTLPYGTSNDLAALFKIPKDPKEQLSLIYNKTEHSLNMVKINDQYFVYAAGIGKFTKVSYSVNRRYLKWLGSIMYIIAMIPDIFRRYKMCAKISYNNSTLHVNANLILVLAGYRTGGFNLKHLNGKEFCENELSVIIFRRRSMFSWIKFIYFYLSKGKLTKHDYHIKTNQVVIETNSKNVWNIDGEAGDSGFANITLIKDALTVYKNGGNDER